MLPAVGFSSPAIKRRSVDLPEPLGPMSPVVPREKVVERPSKTVPPEGQEKLRRSRTTG